MPLTNKEETLWVLAIIKNCHFECRSEHGLVPECSLVVGCFYLTCNGFGWLSHYRQCFGGQMSLQAAVNCIKQAAQTVWKRSLFHQFLAFVKGETQLLLKGQLCSALNIRVEDFYCVYNVVLICTFNAHLSEINMTKQVHSYNPTLKI